MRKERGRPITKGRDPVSGYSPWWVAVASELSSGRPDLVGRNLTIEELTQIIPDYPDGRRPRPRTVARRLARVLDLVSRGPNGSLGRGATYRIVPNVDVGPDTIQSDDEWLRSAADRMTTTKGRRSRID